jgi:enoyl-CoA hydratase
MDFKNLLLAYEDKVAILTINRLEALNSLNTEVLMELACALNYLEKNEEVHVIVITGAGKAFVAGADIKEMKDKNPQEARLFSQLGSEVFKKIEEMDKPVIAAVNGFAFGGGCELVMACDIIIASEKAKFSQPEVGLGIIPGFAGTQRLPRIVGVKKAKELILTGEIIGAEEAERIKMVNKVVPEDELISSAIEIAKKISCKGQIAVRYAKSSINLGLNIDINTGNAIETNLFALCFATEDQKERMHAFIEKRKAKFPNKQITEG